METVEVRVEHNLLEVQHLSQEERQAHNSKVAMVYRVTMEAVEVVEGGMVVVVEVGNGQVVVALQHILQVL